MTPDQQSAAVTEEIRTYGDQLVPGAAEHLGRMWQSIGGFAPARLSEEVARRMDGPLVERFRNPAYDAKADGADPVRAAVARQSGKLRDGVVDQVANDLRSGLVGRPAPLVARRVAEYIAANPGYQKDPPPEPAHIAHVRALVGANFAELSPGGVDRLVAERGHEFRGVADDQVIRSVATALGSSVVADRYGATRTVATDDARRRGVAVATVTVTRPAQARDAGGKFAEGGKPAAPPRRRMSF